MKPYNFQLFITSKFRCFLIGSLLISVLHFIFLVFQSTTLQHHVSFVQVSTTSNPFPFLCSFFHFIFILSRYIIASNHIVLATHIPSINNVHSTRNQTQCEFNAFCAFSKTHSINRGRQSTWSA